MAKCDLMVRDGDIHLWSKDSQDVYGVGMYVGELPKVLRPKFKKDGRYQLTGYARARKGLVNFKVQWKDDDPWYRACYVDGSCYICDEFLEAILGGSRRLAGLEKSRGVEMAHVKIEKL